MKHTFKRAMSLFMALAMVLTMVPSFGTHVHAEELETEPVVVTEEPATEAPVVEVPVEEVPETEAPTQAPETEAPATEAPTEPATEAPEIVETEAPEVTEEAPEVVETEPAEETEATEETFPEEILEEEIVEEEAVAVALPGGPDNIGLDGVATYWTVNGSVVKGSVTGQKYTATRYGARSTELIITNNMATQATLGFDFVASGYFSVGSTVTIDGVTYAAETSSSYEKQLDAGASITIKLSAANTSTNNKGINTVNLDITNLSLAVKGISVTTTFQAPGYGSYTVSYGEEVQTIAAGGEALEIDNDSSVKYTLTAIPGDGNKFIGWYDVNAEKYISTTAVCVTAFSGASTIMPIIVPNATAVFQVGNGNYFVDLDDAASYAEKNGINQITLIDSGYIYDAEYTIPAGVTLLVPRDDAYTPQASKPDYTEAHTAPTPYMTLTLAKDTKIVVKGSVEVEAIHTTTQGSKLTGNRPCGPYGAIYMNAGSNITLEDDAALYAWGYVYGEGSVTVSSGAKVYEYMQVTDFPGGTNLSKFADMDLTSDADGDEIPDNDYVKSFPLSQYYVQNVEVPMTLYAGAVEYVYATITAGGQSLGMPVEFIGNSGMFVPASGCIIKDYDEKTDRMIVDVYGNASVAGIVLDFAKSGLADSLLAAIAGVLGDTKFDSSRYIFGLNSNITINVNEGTTTIKQDIALFPGVEVNIAQNAVLAITAGESHNITVFGTGGNNVYAYDLDQWGNFVFNNKKLSPVSYSPSKDRYTRTVNDLKDVVIDVNGKIIADGYLYSTVAYSDDGVEAVSGGAAIISSQKTGVVAMNNGAGAEMLMYRLDGTSSRDDMSTIESAWLKNGDGTYLQTAGAEAGATFSYCATHDKWYTGECEDCGSVVTYTVKWVVDGKTVMEEEVEEGMKADFGGEAPTKEGYTFIGWDYDEDGKVDEEQPAVTADATYTAVFEINTYTVTWMDAKDTTKWENIEHGKVIDTAETADEKAYDATYHYTFSHWEDAAGNKLTEGTTKVTGDVTFTAVYTETAHSYTTEVEGTKVDATCMAAGSVTKKCVCGAEKTEVLPIDKTNHTKQNTTVKDAVEATCGKEGYTGDTYCECGEKIETGNPISATGEHVDGNDKNHDCDNCSATNVDDGCYGGTAYCNAKPICAECGQEYGEKNPTNHASDEVTKVFKDSEYHTVTHTCCGTPEVVEHDSGDVTCSCGGISFYMMFDDESVDLISFTSGGVVPDGSFIDPSKPVTVEAKHNVGSGVIIMYINPQGLSVESYSGTLEIPADKINPNARLVVYIDATVNVTIQLNGGSIPEAVKAEMHAMGITVTDSAFVYPAVYNGGDWCPIAELVTYDGHSIESVTDKDGKNYYYVDVEEVGPEIVLKNLTEDLELTINWTCDALTDVAEVPATCGADGVKAHKVCACSKAYDADGNEIADLEAWKKADGKINATGEHVDGDDANHDCDNCDATNVDEGHAGGTATCMAAAVCAECGQSYGETDPSNHASDDVTYTNNGDTHSATYDCCKAPYVTNEPHTYVDGICVCEAVQTFTVTFDGNGKDFYIYADRNYVDTLPVTVTYGTAAEALGVGEADAEDNGVWDIDCDGMVLSGWNTKADGTGEHYAIGAEIKPTGDMTLYAIWKEVAVGGVGLNSGEYLDLNGNVTTTQPEGGYAYYTNGTLTLNNYSYTGEGYMHQVNPDRTAAVYGKLKPLTIVLVGENSLKNTFTDGNGSAVCADTLTIQGEGTLTAEAAYSALEANEAMFIQGGSLNLNSARAIFSYGTVTVSGGTVTGNGHGYAEDGWTFENNVTILKPQGGNAGEDGYLYDANGYTANSFKLARAYTVTFLDKYGEQIGEAQTVEHGKSATAPTAPEVTGYTFTNWDKDFTAVTSDLTVQAVYTVNEYTLTVYILAKDGEAVELTVPYGANLLEVLAAAAQEGKIPAIGDKFDVNIPNYHIGYSRTTHYSYLISADEGYGEVDESMTMPAGDFEIDQDSVMFGWIFTDRDGDGVYGAEYYSEEDGYLTGWQYVEEDFDDVEGGAWYYFDTVLIDDVEYYYRAEGITRVPYPEETINGITYGPNEEDLEYAEEHNKTFLDKDTGLFVFGDDGKFQQNHSGVSEYEGENRKVTNGLIEWHPGVVDLAQYLYFIGDEEVGGNKLATGDVYVARNSTSREFVIGGVYTFSESGPLCEYDGITEVNGKLRYYEDAQLMLGKGLTKVGENYIYVRSNGELVVNNEYYISANSLGIATGIYEFDENGYMIDPAPADKNGVFAEDGGLYYYENGKRTYAGLTEYNGGIIYVTSSGKLATGKYYVTKVNDTGYEAGFYFFDEEGYMEDTTRNGIVDGKYYVNGEVQYSAGLIEYNGGLIYVRSNGEVVMDQAYWITNTNDRMPAGCYEFDSEGFLQVDESLNGVVGLNYYIDGIKQFGNGLVQVEGGYIYVKTNGELATGTYWITRTNGLKDAGCYEFSADGYMILG